ncbi:MAG: glycine betaine ABC transporter substrate-binding protein, partial [Planctomycetota bacterium]
MKAALLIPLIALALPLGATPQASVGVAAKKFTESVILSLAVEQLLELEDLEVENRGELGGTRILWNALLAGEIDVYPEYTGTILHEILAEENLSSWPEARAHLEALGLRVTESIGFENNYALGVTRELHQELELQAISDLSGHPHLRFGLGGEFMDREDGWKGLRLHYALPQTDVEGLDHDLAYRALQAGQIDLMDLYRTDAEIEAYDLVALEDDRSYFPSYSALFV